MVEHSLQITSYDNKFFQLWQFWIRIKSNYAPLLRPVAREKNSGHGADFHKFHNFVALPLFRNIDDFTSGDGIRV
jgi:hypothetical protein